MMKRLILCAMVLLFASCQKDAGLTYNEKNGIYFVHNYKIQQSTIFTKIVAFDKVNYSFGMADESLLKDTAKIAVAVLGKASDQDRFYRVSLSADSTTAIEGIHYETIQPLQKFRANRLVDTLKIVVLRENLNGSHIIAENRKIKLMIEQSDDFNVGVKKGAQMNLMINNYLAEPKWWKSYVSSGLYYYHPEKWKILMRFSDAFKNPESDNLIDYTMQTTYFNSLRTYLLDNPTFDKETNERVLIDRLEK